MLSNLSNTSKKQILDFNSCRCYIEAYLGVCHAYISETDFMWYHVKVELSQGKGFYMDSILLCRNSRYAYCFQTHSYPEPGGALFYIRIKFSALSSW